MKKIMIRFRPQILDALKGYNKERFISDLIAGIVVGIVALPLAIAFAIASGVSPEKGIFTAIIAGFIIAVLGGSNVQIGGPTGAFIVVVYSIVQQFGVDGLIIATFLAGILLVLMGIARLGSVIKFIPYPLIAGFTTGIAVIIFSSQMKDLFGLSMGTVPADFLHKWAAYLQHYSSVNIYAAATGVFTLLIMVLWPKVNHKIPGSLIAIVFTTIVVQMLGLPVETIGSRFGTIPSALPLPSLPHLHPDMIPKLIGPAFTIALLGGIESLLSAVVADGMTGGKHRSNTELIAQGAANIFSSLFGGIPATGAIARTATNIKNGGRTPVAGIVHALTLMIILFFAGRWAALIPMATLAGILIMVAFNMSEIHQFISILKGPKSDVAILLITFLLTVLVDLTLAIETGMIVAVFLFMRDMMKISAVRQLSHTSATAEDTVLSNNPLPEEVQVFEINGPLFFGAAYKFQDAMNIIKKNATVLILRMGHVPIIDATGIRILTRFHEEAVKKGTKLVLSEVNSRQVAAAVKQSRLQFKIGKANITGTFDQAVKRSHEILHDHRHKGYH